MSIAEDIMGYRTIEFAVKDRVCWITLNRPAAMNSLSDEMIAELMVAVEDVRTNPDIRVLVLTGAGKAFCCGADLKGVLADVMGGDASSLVEFVGRAQDMINKVRDLPKPTIAALNGMTLAGGLELTLACDIVVAAESAQIGDAHSNYAVLPGAGGGTLLPRVVGEKKANYLLYTGEFMTASEFEKMGLVSQLVADEDLVDTVEVLAQKLASKSPLVMSQMKRMVTEGVPMPVQEALDFEKQLLREHSQSKDLLEGLKAFAEKRTPTYTGE